jgi:hypothetical protein
LVGRGLVYSGRRSFAFVPVIVGNAYLQYLQRLSYRYSKWRLLEGVWVHEYLGTHEKDNLKSQNVSSQRLLFCS